MGRRRRPCRFQWWGVDPRRRRNWIWQRGYRWKWKLSPWEEPNTALIQATTTNFEDCTAQLHRTTVPTWKWFDWTKTPSRTSKCPRGILDLQPVVQGEEGGRPTQAQPIGPRNHPPAWKDTRLLQNLQHERGTTQGATRVPRQASGDGLHPRIHVGSSLPSNVHPEEE